MLVQDFKAAAALASEAKELAAKLDLQEQEMAGLRKKEASMQAQEADILERLGLRQQQWQEHEKAVVEGHVNLLKVCSLYLLSTVSYK